LIIHGWHDCTDNYLAFQEKLAKKGFRVIFPHLPGFGKSELTKSRGLHLNDYVEYLLEFSDKLKLGKFYIFAHCINCLTAIKFAVLHPQRVNGLALYAFYSLPIFLAKISRPLLFIGLPLFFMATKISIISLRISTFFKMPLPAALRKLFKWFERTQDFYRRKKGAMYKTLRNIVSEDLAKISRYLARIKIPTLFIFGNKDILVSVKKADFFRKKINGSSLEILNGGHSIQRDEPEKLADPIDKFVKSLI